MKFDEMFRDEKDMDLLIAASIVLDRLIYEQEHLGRFTQNKVSMYRMVKQDIDDRWDAINETEK